MNLFPMPLANIQRFQDSDSPCRGIAAASWEDKAHISSGCQTRSQKASVLYTKLEISLRKHKPLQTVFPIIYDATHDKIEMSWAWDALCNQDRVNGLLEE